jgi:hypothetical protein
LLDALPAGDYGDSNYSGITAYLLGEREKPRGASRETGGLRADTVVRLPQYHDQHREPVRRLSCYTVCSEPGAVVALQVAIGLHSLVGHVVAFIGIEQTGSWRCGAECEHLCEVTRSQTCCEIF